MKGYLLTALISLTFLSCSEKSNPVNPGDDGSLILSGHIANSNSCYELIYIYTYPNPDSALYAEVSGDYFILKIPVPAHNNLHNYIPFNHISVINNDTTMFIDSVQIGEPDMKYRLYYLTDLCTSEVSFSLDLTPAKVTPLEFAQVGDYYISYYYFDTETTIRGYYKWRVVVGDSSRETITEYNVNTNIGWNKLITKLKSQAQDKSIYEITNAGSEPVEWIIGAISKFRNYNFL